MKKVFISLAIVAVMFAVASCACCGNKAAEAQCDKASCCDSIVATDIVPAAATEVLPAAAPSAENGGKVATEVIPAEPAK